MAALRFRRPAVAGLVAAVLVVAHATQAEAAWTAAASGSAVAESTTVPPGPTPAVSVNGRNVTITWPAATLASGDVVSGYRVRRWATAGTAATIGAACTGVQPGIS